MLFLCWMLPDSYVQFLYSFNAESINVGSQLVPWYFRKYRNNSKRPSNTGQYLKNGGTRIGRLIEVASIRLRSESWIHRFPLAPWTGDKWRSVSFIGVTEPPVVAQLATTLPSPLVLIPEHTSFRDRDPISPSSPRMFTVARGSITPYC